MKKPLEKPLIPMVDMWKTNDIPSCPKIYHRYGLPCHMVQNFCERLNELFQMVQKNLPKEKKNELKKTHPPKTIFFLFFFFYEPFPRLKSCRDPGHRRHFPIISFGWDLVSRWSRAGELWPQGLPKKNVARPNGQPRLQSPGRLLLRHLRDLPWRVVAAFAGHNRIQGRAQQCDNGRCGSPYRRGLVKLNWVDPSGRLWSPPRPIHSAAWKLPLYHPSQCQCPRGDRWLGFRGLCYTIPYEWRHWDASHIIGPTANDACMWCLPGLRQPTGE